MESHMSTDPTSAISALTLSNPLEHSSLTSLKSASDFSTTPSYLDMLTIV